MSVFKYCALDENEEVPHEFVAIRNVNGVSEFCASFINTNFLAYENDVLLKFHQRNDELRAENAKLRSMVKNVLILIHDPSYEWLDSTMADLFCKGFTEQARELGIEV